MIKNPFLKRVISLVSGTALGQIIILAATPILTRLYLPSDFGVLAIIMAIVITFNVFGSLRLELAIPLVKDKQLKDMLGLNIIVLIFISFLSGLFAILVINLPNFEGLTGIQGLLIPVSVLLIGLYHVFSYVLIRENDFNLLARTKIRQSIGLVTVQLVLGLIKPSSLSLLTGEIVGRFYGLSMILKQKKSIFFSKRRFSMKRIKLLFFKYIKFPLYSAPASLINTLGVQGMPVLLVYFYSPVVGGLYSITQKLISSPVQLIGKSVSQVFYGQISEYSETPKKIKKLFIKMSSILFGIGVLVTITFLLLRPLVFNYILGPEWTSAEPIFSILALLIAFEVSVAPLSEVLSVVNRQEMRLKWDILRLVALISVFLVSDFYNATYLSMFNIYAVIMAIMYVLLFILSYIGIDQYIKESGGYNEKAE